MKTVKNSLILSALVLLLGTSCNDEKQKAKEKKDDILVGELPVMVDETILPLFLEHKEVFESSYTNAHIIPQPKSEVQAINGLIKGEGHIAYLTRELTEEENKSFKERSIQPRVYEVAYDALVLIGNKGAADSSITIAQIVDLLKGTKKGNSSLVLQDPNSSLLRYFRDLGNIDKVANTYVALEDQAIDVLQRVATESNKIGLISFNQYLSLESSFTEKDKIRILSVLNDKLDTPKYVKPSQASLSTDEYPLKRTIYVLNYQPNLGLGIGFSAFITGDRGQRIVLKSGLLPATMPGREIIIREQNKLVNN